MVTSNSKTPPTHFNGKDALNHVVEAQAQGFVSASEVHGTETSGNLSAGGDAARETAITLLLLWVLLISFDFPFNQSIQFLLIFSVGWLFWKTGRSAWLAWFRLERLHRILEQERWEIEHHQQQERDELRVLYAAKGFEGKLLEDVLDVLMADNDRLLRVMIEEELGLSLAAYQHPLKQALGATAGVLISTFLCLTLLWLLPYYGLFVGAILTIGIASAFSAYLSQNKLVPAIVWNMGLAILACGCTYFLYQLIQISMGK